MKLIPLYVGNASFIPPDGSEPRAVGIPNGLIGFDPAARQGVPAGGQMGFDRVKIVALANGWVAVYCIVPDEYTLDVVIIDKTPKESPALPVPGPQEVYGSATTQYDSVK